MTNRCFSQQITGGLSVIFSKLFSYVHNNAIYVSSKCSELRPQMHSIYNGFQTFETTLKIGKLYKKNLNILKNIKQKIKKPYFSNQAGEHDHHDTPKTS